MGRDQANSPQALVCVIGSLGKSRQISYLLLDSLGSIEITHKYGDARYQLEVFKDYVEFMKALGNFEHDSRWELYLCLELTSGITHETPLGYTEMETTQHGLILHHPDEDDVLSPDYDPREAIIKEHWFRISEIKTIALEGPHKYIGFFNWLP